MNKNKWKVITGILLIFLIGAFSGTLGTGFYMKKRIKRFIDPKGPPPPVRILYRQMDKLDLTPKQRSKIDILLQQTKNEFVVIIEKLKPDLEAHFNRHVALLRAELTPTQQKSFDKTIVRLRDRLKQKTTPPYRLKQPAAILTDLQAELSLTPEQIHKSELVIVSMEKKKREIMDRYDKARELLREKRGTDMELLLDEIEEELTGFLSVEQAELMRKAYEPMALSPKR